MTTEALSKLIPDSTAAAQGFLETILGAAPTINVSDPTEASLSQIKTVSGGWFVVHCTPEKSTPFAAFLDPGWIEPLSKGMMGEAVPIEDEGTPDLVKELASQCYGSIKNQLPPEFNPGESGFEFIMSVSEFNPDGFPESLLQIPFTMDHEGAELKGLILLSDEDTGPVAPPAEEPVAAEAAPTPGPAAPPPAQPMQPVEVAQPQFQDFAGGGENPEVERRNFDLLVEVEIEVAVELGRRRMPLSEILRLTTGSVIELEKLAGEPLEVYANGRLIAEGEAVVIDEKFGIRVTRLASSKEKRTKAFIQ